MIPLSLTKERSQRTRTSNSLAAFKSCVSKLGILLEENSADSFLSPYSLVAAASQLIGLDGPLYEAGSLSNKTDVSLRPEYKDLFADEQSLNYQQKKQLISELYDMVAPIVLGEAESYLELLLNTRYRQSSVGLSRPEAASLRHVLSERISLFEPVVKRLLGRKETFAHIGHFGSLGDLYREQDFLGSLGEEAREQWFGNSYPIVIELHVSGFCDKDISGWIIFLPNSSEQLLMNEPLRKKKLLQAATLGERLGADIIGLAGLSASFSRGGHFLAKRIQGVGFTTGHAFTIANIMRITRKVSETFDLDLSEATIAVVGAAGSVGSGVTKLLASNGIKNIILIDRDDMVAARRVEMLKEVVAGSNGTLRVTTSTDLHSLQNADLVILATCAPEGIIKSNHIKPGAIFIDDSYPKNVSPTILAERDDFILIEGGITQLPSSVNMNLSRSIPQLIDAPLETIAATKQTYACFVETLVLAATGHRGHFGLGDASPSLAADIEKKAVSLNISTAPFQAFGRLSEDSRIEKVKRIIKQR